MARIRSIKTEFWTSEQIVSCTITARLLFIGMWTFCDDNGIHPASVTRLKLQVFPADSISNSELQNLIDELVRADLLIEYQAGINRYWQVTGWAKHQRIEKPTFKHPTPPIKAEAPIIPQVLDDNSTTTPRLFDSPSGTEWSGVESNTLSDKSDCLNVLNYLNSKIGSRFRSVPANLKLISARLKEGATVADCKSVIDAKVAEWSEDSKLKKYLRPATLFSAENFAQYVGQLGTQAKEQQWE